MYTCDQYREQIWDDQFGLLEPGDRETLQRHLAACGACRAEMANAITEHQLIARAARLDIDVPPFAAPSLDSDQPSFRFQPPSSIAVKRRWRGLPWLAMAAAILLLIGLPFSLYQYGHHRYVTAWQTAENAVARIVQQREELQAQARMDQDNLVRVALAAHLRLQAVGPAAYERGVVHPYRVWVTDVKGNPAQARIKARLLDAGEPVELAAKELGGQGEWLVELPANLPLPPEGTPRLELVASGQEDASPIRAHLRVLEPAYRTHLAADKRIYQPGETIFFRSLTLERFGLKVPNREFTAVFTLVDAQRKDVRTLRGLTRKDGIGGGAFELPPGATPGEYTLTVAEAEKRFPPVSQRLWLQSAMAPRNVLPSGRGWEIEFFPEGGDLVAGLDNRVYFRVRTPQGQPADLQGALVDSHDREVVRVQTVRAKGRPAPSCSLGVFTLRPQAGEVYRLRVTSPENTDIRAVLPPAQATGLCLSLPAAVVRPDEPIRAVLQQSGPLRQLVVGLFCHGRLVAQELVAGKAGNTEIMLTPTVTCSGIVRFTVFEERDGQLWPIAERLAYRQPDRRLVLAVQKNKDIYAGEAVQLKLRSLNEKGELQPASLLVSVVDEKASAGLTNASEASLPAYFHLTSELEQPEDLEDADVLLSDGPEAAAALDLFLGTQGWRRFTEPMADATFVKATAGATQRPQDWAVPAILKLDNQEQVDRRYALSLDQASAQLHDSLARRAEQLTQEGAERLQLARNAARELNGYEQRTADLVRLGAGLGGVALMAAACLFLGVALLRLARGLGGRRAYLSSAFAALSVCLLIYWGSASGWGRNKDAIDRSRIAGYAEKLDKRLDFASLALPNHEGMAASRVLSKGRGTFSQEPLERPLAAATSKGENEAAKQGQMPPSVSPNRRPRIGIIRAVPSSESRTSVTPDKSAPLPIRSYAYLASHGARASTETILWQPILITQNGTAEVNITLPPQVATYCIRVQGHDAAGRLGAVQETLECWQKPAGVAK
jgi:hypothetical protein